MTIPSRNTPPLRDRLAGLARSARPRQWIKNLACFAGLIFSRHLFDVGSGLAAILAFGGFCLASSAVYLVNDVCDRRSDAANPKKRSRPVASGLVPVGWAVATAGALASAAVASALLLPRACGVILAAYLVMSLAYSLRLKHTVLLDVVLIAVGFVLRILYGVYAVSVLPTPWIVLCMFFLALFLGFAKRRSELAQAEGDVTPQRPVLLKYRTELLDLLLAMTATMAILCYALYTVTGRPNGETLVITVPLVVYGVYRYLLLVIVFDVGDSPDRDVFDDIPLVATTLLWIATCIVIIYFKVNIIEFQPTPLVAPR